MVCGYATRGLFFPQPSDLNTDYPTILKRDQWGPGGSLYRWALEVNHISLDTFRFQGERVLCSNSCRKTEFCRYAFILMQGRAERVSDKRGT